MVPPVEWAPWEIANAVPGMAFAMSWWENGVILAEYKDSPLRKVESTGLECVTMVG